MKKYMLKGIMLALLAATAMGAIAAEPEPPAMPTMPEMPKPTAEHQWLEQLVGEWETEGRVYMQPGAEPMVTTGTETVRSLGGFWVVAEGKGEMMGMTVSSLMTLGYDPEQKKYLGTWVSSCDKALWQYEGTVDETGKMLTLTTEGSCPGKPEKITKFREVMEINGPDRRTFTSNMLEEDGKWSKLVVVEYRRKK